MVWETIQKIKERFKKKKFQKFKNKKTKKFQKEFGKSQNVRVWEIFSKMAKLYLLEISKMHRTLSSSMSRRPSRIMSKTKKNSHDKKTKGNTFCTID